MALLRIERTGGLAGFGGPGSHIRSQGQIEFESLSDAEQRAVDALFQSRRSAKSSKIRDGFSYKISRTTSSGIETIEVPESRTPAPLAACVKDELT